MPCLTGHDRLMKNSSAHLFRAFGTDGQFEASAPDWIHLLPAGVFSAWDGRGPFTLKDPDNVIATSMAKGPLPIDQDHATDYAQQTGVSAPARGWIVEMQARKDGVWGRVEWTETGKALLADRAYRGISPVIIFDKDKVVLAIRRAALTNDPALDQLTTVFSGDQDMNWKEKLAALVGLGADASDEDVLAAVEKAMAKPDDTASMAALKAQADEQIAVLSAKVDDLKGQLLTMSAEDQRKEATRLVDAAISEGKPIKARREDWIELFASSPDKAKALLEAMPSINGEPVKGDDGEQKSAALSAEEAHVTKLLGLDKDKFLAARRNEEE